MCRVVAYCDVIVCTLQVCRGCRYQLFVPTNMIILHNAKIIVKYFFPDHYRIVVLLREHDAAVPLMCNLHDHNCSKPIGFTRFWWFWGQKCSKTIGFRRCSWFGDQKCSKNICFIRFFVVLLPKMLRNHLFYKVFGRFVTKHVKKQLFL